MGLPSVAAADPMGSNAGGSADATASADSGWPGQRAAVRAGARRRARARMIRLFPRTTPRPIRAARLRGPGPRGVARRANDWVRPVAIPMGLQRVGQGPASGIARNRSGGC